MDYVPLFVEVVKLTDAAALLRYEGNEEWVPRSCIDEDDVDLEEHAGSGADVEIGIKLWKAETLGWA